MGAGNDKSMRATGLGMVAEGPPTFMAGARAISPRPTPGKGAGPLVAVWPTSGWRWSTSGWRWRIFEVNTRGFGVGGVLRGAGSSVTGALGCCECPGAGCPGAGYTVSPEPETGGGMGTGDGGGVDDPCDTDSSILDEIIEGAGDVAIGTRF